MSEFSVNLSDESEHSLNLAAHEAFDAIFTDIMFSQVNGPDDYPVGAVVLDKTGTFVLGEGVANDSRTQTPISHAEVNAIIAARLNHGEHLTKGGVIVSTLQSCASCMEKAKITGIDSLIAYVTSRQEIEEMGHVVPRSASYGSRPIKEVRLTHPELQEKGKILYSGDTLTRDPETGIVVIKRELLQRKLADIGLLYPILS